MGIRETFDEMMGGLVKSEADDLLDRHMERTRKWIEMKEAKGETVTLADLIKKLHGEPNRKGPVVAAYGAALWRLMGKS